MTDSTNSPTTSLYEVHEHAVLSGGSSRRVKHSHEGGNFEDGRHTHPDMGPASYTIDRDEWYRQTGIRGGGRKKFTKRPNGPQYELIPQEPVVVKIFVRPDSMTDSTPIHVLQEGA